jgi:hypothetical protein
VNIVRELMRGSIPNFWISRDIAEELRSLAVEMKKKGMSVAQASLVKGAILNMAKVLSKSGEALLMSLSL